MTDRPARYNEPQQGTQMVWREQKNVVSYTYKNGEPVSITKIGRLIDNAAPVKLGTIIEKCINSHLKNRGVV